jgi:hypothetical protein
MEEIFKEDLRQRAVLDFQLREIFKEELRQRAGLDFQVD